MKESRKISPVEQQGFNQDLKADFCGGGAGVVVHTLHPSRGRQSAISLRLAWST